jgi:hypothetical protein
MDPRQLRDLVEAEISDLIDWELWGQQESLQEREKKSVEAVLKWWSVDPIKSHATLTNSAFHQTEPDWITKFQEYAAKNAA